MLKKVIELTYGIKLRNKTLSKITIFQQEVRVSVLEMKGIKLTMILSLSFFFPPGFLE